MKNLNDYNQDPRNALMRSAIPNPAYYNLYYPFTPCDEEFKNISDVFEEDVYQAIDVNTCVNKRNTIGACGQEMMKKVIALNEEYLKQF